MLKIEEKKDGSQICFQLIETKGNDDKINILENISYPTYIKKHKHDDKNYFLLFDDYMNLNLKVFEFLNHALASYSENSRKIYLFALKLLFSFERIVGKSLKEFDMSDINLLKMFLKGYSFKGQNLELDLETTRSNSTINNYFSVYRSYLNFLGEKNDYLNLKNNYFSFSIDEQNNDVIVHSKYLANEKVHKPIQEVPKYISFEDYKTLGSEIVMHYTLREEIIVSLMYECGLRIGECLGLTLEDITMEMVDGNYIPVIYIRNRASDKKFQFAKTCMDINNTAQYKLPEYNVKGYGYQKIFPPERLYEKINDYLDKTHSKFISSEKKYNLSKADKVTNEELFYGNHYIFLNSKGTPLSDASWNNILREIFERCNITIDTGKRQNNLNHRFRHGYAMYLIKYLNVDAYTLMRALRHSSLNSTVKYFKPTVTDQIELKDKFTKDLYNKIDIDIE